MFWSVAISRQGMNWKGRCRHLRIVSGSQKWRKSFSSHCISGLSQLVSGQIPTQQLVFIQIATESYAIIYFFFSQLLFLRKNLMKTLGSSSAHSAAVCMAESKTAPCSHTLFFQLLLAGEHRTKLSCHLLENSPSLWLILRGISALCSPALSGCQALYFQLVHLWYVQQGHAGQVGSISCFPIAELFQNSLFWPISPTCWLKA